MDDNGDSKSSRPELYVICSGFSVNSHGERDTLVELNKPNGDKVLMVLLHHCTLVKLAQIKIVAADDTVEKFKRIVLAKHGKLEISAEGEEALKLYIKKHERLLGEMIPPGDDPLKRMCGIGRSHERHNVLKDLERLEAGEL